MNLSDEAERANPHLQSLPSGKEVEVADPEVLSEAEYAAVAARTCEYRPTEYGNAQRLAVLFGRDIRFVVEEKTWYVWTGTHWTPDVTGEVMRRAKTVARVLWRELVHVDGAVRGDWVMNARKSETKAGLRAMVELAATEKITTVSGEAIAISCSADVFDTNPRVLNCPNGTLDLRTGRLPPHRREDMLRRITPVPYDGKARSLEWERFLRHCVGGDPELLRYLQMLAGATLLGDSGHDVVPLIYGPPASGKSTFIRALQSPLGVDYADTASLETFAERRATNAPRDDLARLEGLRMVACVEGERNHTLAVGLLKQISGGDTVSARHLYQSTRTWTPVMTVWIAVNERPRIPRDEDGVWRRVKAIPFENQVGVIDPGLRDRLSDPALTGEAVLAWAVKGARKLAVLAGPLPDPAAVMEATAEYREEQTPGALGDWLAACCQDADVRARTNIEDLRASYEAWCAATGAHRLSMKAWGTEMGFAYKRGRTSKARFYRGIRLR